MCNIKQFKMKIPVLCIALLTLLSLNAFAQGKFKTIENGYAKKIMNTKVPGGVDIETIMEIYFADYGRIMATYTTEKRNITMANMVEVKKSVTIVEGDWSTTYDPETKTGTKIKLDMADKFSNMSESDMQKMAEQLKGSTNTQTEDIGTKVIAGQTCTGTKATTDLMGMKSVSEIWMLEGFVMESTSSGSGVDVSEKVVEFVPGADFDNKYLEVPDNVKVKEVKTSY